MFRRARTPMATDGFLACDTSWPRRRPFFDTVEEPASTRILLTSIWPIKLENATALTILSLKPARPRLTIGAYVCRACAIARRCRGRTRQLQRLLRSADQARSRARRLCPTNRHPPWIWPIATVGYAVRRGKSSGSRVHLAAQAGVRYSRRPIHTQPTSTAICRLVNMLELCRHRGVQHLA
jgi:hypothetical protein